MLSVIPPKKNRKGQSDYDKELYKARNLVENACLSEEMDRRLAS